MSATIYCVTVRSGSLSGYLYYHREWDQYFLSLRLHTPTGMLDMNNIIKSTSDASLIEEFCNLAEQYGGDSTSLKYSYDPHRQKSGVEYQTADSLLLNANSKSPADQSRAALIPFRPRNTD